MPIFPLQNKPTRRIPKHKLSQRDRCRGLLWSLIKWNSGYSTSGYSEMYLNYWWYYWLEFMSIHISWNLENFMI